MVVRTTSLHCKLLARSVPRRAETPPCRQPLRGEKHVRTVGLVYVVAFVVVLVAVRLQAGTEAPPAVAPPDPSALAPGRRVAALDRDGTDQGGRRGRNGVSRGGPVRESHGSGIRAKPRQTVAPPPVPSRRNYRRRSRNRYPEPIPTPADLGRHLLRTGQATE